MLWGRVSEIKERFYAITVEASTPTSGSCRNFREREKPLYFNRLTSNTSKARIRFDSNERIHEPSTDGLVADLGPGLTLEFALANCNAPRAVRQFVPQIIDFIPPPCVRFTPANVSGFRVWIEASNFWLNRNIRAYPFPRLPQWPTDRAGTAVHHTLVRLPLELA